MGRGERDREHGRDGKERKGGEKDCGFFRARMGGFRHDQFIMLKTFFAEVRAT